MQHKTCTLNVKDPSLVATEELIASRQKSGRSPCLRIVRRQKPMYFYGHRDGMNFYCNAGSF